MPHSGGRSNTHGHTNTHTHTQPHPLMTSSDYPTKASQPCEDRAGLYTHIHMHTYTINTNPFFLLSLSQCVRLCCYASRVINADLKKFNLTKRSLLTAAAHQNICRAQSHLLLHTAPLARCVWVRLLWIFPMEETTVSWRRLVSERICGFWFVMSLNKNVCQQEFCTFDMVIIWRNTNTKAVQKDFMWQLQRNSWELFDCGRFKAVLFSTNKSWRLMINLEFFLLNWSYHD